MSLISGRNTNCGDIGEIKGVVRVNEYEQTMTFQRNESGNGTKGKIHCGKFD